MILVSRVLIEFFNFIKVVFLIFSFLCVRVIFVLCVLIFVICFVINLCFLDRVCNIFLGVLYSPGVFERFVIIGGGVFLFSFLDFVMIFLFFLFLLVVRMIFVMVGVGEVKGLGNFGKDIVVFVMMVIINLLIRIFLIGSCVMVRFVWCVRC